MHLTITIPPAQLRDVLPSEQELAQAAGRGVSNIVKRRLVDRDRRGRSDGLPRTGYYGGVVYPTSGHKALAIPKSIQGAGKRPAEADPDHTKFALVWPKGKTTGTLRDKETDEVVYLLVPKATIPEDKTILPTEDEMKSAGMAAMEAIL